MTSLPHITDVPSLGAHDLAVLDQVHALLARHGMEHRFSIGLAHQHFALADDEVLCEFEGERELLTRPVKKSELPAGAGAAEWLLTDDGPRPLRWCYSNLGPHA